jgi:hypothetical protein
LRSAHSWSASIRVMSTKVAPRRSARNPPLGVGGRPGGYRRIMVTAPRPRRRTSWVTRAFYAVDGESALVGR